ncbi:FK506-binding protein [Thelonectria olida]|uniref:peptidylprolyl isomerase n=1 Tax=Thelonectria olida TaxID=1576542 RepID=A0A9P8WD06_9HYPO|nr:FK506-binding protein [Thelonectria olida]
MLPIKRLASLALSSRKLPLLPPSSTSAIYLSTRAKSTIASTINNMGVQKTILREGSGAIPSPGDEVTIEYTGWLKDANGQKGDKFDSSVGRGDFVVTIGVGQVIKGWDEGVTTMKQGEKSTLDISSDFGYGPRGFPGHIPPHSDLIFDVELKKVVKSP